MSENTAFKRASDWVKDKENPWKKLKQSEEAVREPLLSRDSNTDVLVPSTPPRSSQPISTSSSPVLPPPPHFPKSTITRINPPPAHAIARPTPQYNSDTPRQCDSIAVGSVELCTSETSSLDDVSSPDRPHIPTIEYHNLLPAPDEPELTEEQKSIFERVMEGENVFFTGSAGTGKSVLLRAIIKEYRQRDEEDRHDEDRAGRWRVAVTATTGIAASNIGGTTLHSWSCIGLGTEPVETLSSSIKDSQEKRKHWTDYGILIVDEVSMLSGELFDKLEKIGREVRNSIWPFGGLEMVLCGDFLQLPPVPSSGRPPPPFAFQADTWVDVITVRNTYFLKQVFRQSDMHFVTLLEKLRVGTVKRDEIIQMSELCRTVTYNDDIEPVQLFASNKEVTALNTRRLKELPGPSQNYVATDCPGLDNFGRDISLEAARKALDSETRFARKLELKIGAAVMPVFNMHVSLGWGHETRMLIAVTARNKESTTAPSAKW